VIPSLGTALASRYSLERELGAGGMATVYLAEDLRHAHILPLFDSGEGEGHLFYVMPFVEGETLRDRLQRDGQLPVDEALRIAALRARPSRLAGFRYSARRA